MGGKLYSQRVCFSQIIINAEFHMKIGKKEACKEKNIFQFNCHQIKHFVFITKLSKCIMSEKQRVLKKYLVDLEGLYLQEIQKKKTNSYHVSSAY